MCSEKREISRLSLKQNLFNALDLGDVDAVMAALGAIDKVLTGSLLGAFVEDEMVRNETSERNARQAVVEILACGGQRPGIIYLGDGVSRLVVEKLATGWNIRLVNESPKAAESWSKIFAAPNY